MVRKIGMNAENLHRWGERDNCPLYTFLTKISVKLKQKKIKNQENKHGYNNNQLWVKEP